MASTRSRSFHARLGGAENRSNYLGSLVSGAGDGIRTRDQELGKLLLYQLSYARLMLQPLHFPLDTATCDRQIARNPVYHVLSVHESQRVSKSTK